MTSTAVRERRICQFGAVLSRPVRVLSRSVSLLAVLSSGWAAAGIVTTDLGAAGPASWSILTGPLATDIALSGPGTTLGNVGIASPSGNLQLNADSINGNLTLERRATVNNTALVTGTVSQADLTSPWQAAVTASATFDSLAATSPITSIGNSTGTIMSTGALNVIYITALDLDHGTLTLSGNAGDQFIINDSGGFALNTSQILLNGGLTAADVVFNVINAGSELQASSAVNQSSIVTGILLAPNRSVEFAGMVNGELIAGGSFVHLFSGGTAVSSQSTLPIPEPATLGLLAAGLLLCAGLKKLR